MATPQEYTTVALQAIYGTVRHRLPAEFTERDFQRAVEAGGWSVIPIQYHGEVLGGVLVKDNEIHVGFTTPGMWVRSFIRRTLLPILAEYGAAKTHVAADNTSGLEFCSRLGFAPTRRDGDVVTLICTECRYA